MAKRKLLYRALGELEPALANPKRHDVEAVKASVARFGFLEPIVLDERTGRLVAGHGRVETLVALEALGGRPEWWPEEASWPPDGVTVLKGAWQVPVVAGWSSADDGEAHAAGVALNRVGEGLWDGRELADLLTELDAGAGLAGTGYDRSDLDLLLAELAPRDASPPGEFPSFDENIETEHQCPRCGYEWSGASGKPKAEAGA